jgi:hypothetical protein
VVLEALAADASLVRPRMSRWGATRHEVDKDLPGDELPNSMGD